MTTSCNDTSPQFSPEFAKERQKGAIEAFEAEFIKVGGWIGRQLLFLDAVSHLAAGTVDLLIEGLSGMEVGRQGGDEEAGVGAAGQDLGLGHQPAALVGFKLQGFGGTLCWHRFPFRNLVNSFGKSVLSDSENRCFPPLVKNAG